MFRNAFWVAGAALLLALEVFTGIPGAALGAVLQSLAAASGRYYAALALIPLVVVFLVMHLRRRTTQHSNP